MAIRIYNTLSKRKESFEPIKTGKVSMYVCGPTVYDSCHLGHARSAVVFDVIARYFKVKGFNLVYVRNFTDIDDKIINRANQLGVDAQTISEKFIDEFHEDMDALNVERATIEPKATDHIDQIIGMIEKLIAKDLAYLVDGDVYYSVEKFDEYGKLSGRKLKDMEAGARVEIDRRKRNFFDFALWKSAKPGEPAWDSPWGKGRPGWHIECSAMSTEYLGKTLDIHGGGKDLIFPHHENEIAQSEGAFGKPFARYWIHNGFININQEKMSKSLGNFMTIKEVLKSYHPEAVRLFLLSNHYRSPIDFTEKAMAEASVSLDKIYTLLDRLEEKLESAADIDNEHKENKFCKKFFKAMDDDFNTALGIGILFDAVRTTNRLLDENQDMISPVIRNKILSYQRDILKIGDILGILTESPKLYFDRKKTQSLKKTSADLSLIQKMVKEREEARKRKDWATADQIRKALSEMNIVLEDRPEGTIWKTGN
jgi:cysteinyl-tRNA synthetase